MPVRIPQAIPAGAAVLLIGALGPLVGAARAQDYAQDMGLRGSQSDGLSSPSPLSDSDGAAQPALPAPTAPPPAGGFPNQPLLGAAPDPSGAINYGKPQPKKPKLYQLYKPNPKTSPPLPPLVPYPTSPEARELRRNPNAAAAEANDGTPPNPDTPIGEPPPTVAVIPPLPQPRKLRPDLDPFAPTGVDVGSLRLFPYVELDNGYDTNPNRLSQDVKGSPYSRVEGGLKLQSDWSQNSLTADLHGGYSDYWLYHAADRPDASGTLTGRVDVTRDTQITSDTRFSLATQQPGSPQLAIPNSVFIINRPLIMSYGETLGITHNFNRWQATLRGSFDRYTYGDATQSDGSILALSTENYNDYGAQGRLGYELSPGWLPFVQLGGDVRKHDDYLDYAGFARDSTGIAVKAGTQFEFARLFTGELSVGYATRTYADPRLPRLSAPTIDGSLAYSLSPLTTITLRTGTDLSETITANSSGAISRHVTLDVSHAFTRELTLTATGTYQNDIYVGQPIYDNIFTAVLAADYKLSRSIVLRASYTYERFLSSLADSNITANVFMLGVRLQR